MHGVTRESVRCPAVLKEATDRKLTSYSDSQIWDGDRANGTLKKSSSARFLWRAGRDLESFLSKAARRVANQRV
jgi:hypothetical protein